MNTDTQHRQTKVTRDILELSSATIWEVVPVVLWAPVPAELFWNFLAWSLMLCSCLVWELNSRHFGNTRHTQAQSSHSKHNLTICYRIDNVPELRFVQKELVEDTNRRGSYLKQHLPSYRFLYTLYMLYALYIDIQTCCGVTGETTSVCHRQRELKINWNKKMHLCISNCIPGVRFVNFQTYLYILIFSGIIRKRVIANKLTLFVTYTIQHCNLVETIVVG